MTRQACLAPLLGLAELGSKHDEDQTDPLQKITQSHHKHREQLPLAGQVVDTQVTRQLTNKNAKKIKRPPAFTQDPVKMYNKYGLLDSDRMKAKDTDA